MQDSAVAEAAPPGPNGRARTVREMEFVASLEQCRHCGAPTPDDFEMFGHGDSWALRAICPGCGRPRAFTFRTFGHPLKGAYQRRELGGPSPSEVIRPGQFLAELERMRALLGDDIAVEQLAPVAWRAAAASTDRAVTCILELVKFLPPGGDAIPDGFLGPEDRADRAGRPERYARAWLETHRDWLFALDARFNADAPRIWALDKA